MRFSKSLLQTAFVSAFLLFSFLTSAAQTAPVRARITEAVDENHLVTLGGNTHPLARPEYDRGLAPDSLPARRLLLVLKRGADQEAALRRLLDDQQTKSSRSYHQWLTPEQFGEQFGPADADIQAVSDWLTSQGFTINQVAKGRTVIEFSGSASQVRQAFHTEIHKYEVNGEAYWANASDPRIPAALAPVVAGVASLNNFPRKPMYHRLGTFQRSKATGEVRPLFTFPQGGGYYLAVGPGDFATIYNLPSNYDGTGQTIAIVAESNINPQDVSDFRTMFGLPANSPNIILNGPDPGIVAATGDEGETDIDVQWAGAVAKNATIALVISESTETDAGVDLSALYIVDNDLAPILSDSYGGCEAYFGNAGNAFYSGMWEQAAAQGITVFAASGDSGSAGCDVFYGETAAVYGLAVNGTASTPFNVAVGGTDFNDVGTWSQYWNQTNNSQTQASAKSYIPESTWNDTCAQTGNPVACASVQPDGTDLIAAGGGASNCATSVVTGSGILCTGFYPKPSWQRGTGVPNDGARDIPDVSLFASNGYNASFYVMCEMDANVGSTNSCDLNAPYQDFQGAGGTSVTAPAFAGIMALVNQKTGERQGNANYVLYPLAAKSGASCVSSASMAPTANSSSCIFYDVNVGNISVACQAGSLDCSNQGSSGYGIMVDQNNNPAWKAGSRYDLATGLGSVNIKNLVNNWGSVSFTPSKSTLSLSTSPATNPITLAHGQSVNVSVQVAPQSGSGTPSGDVSLLAQTSSSGGNSATTSVGGWTLSGGAVSGATTNFLPGGTYNVIAHYAGDGTYGASDSNAVPVTVNKEGSETALTLLAWDIYGNPILPPPTSVSYGSPYVLRVDVTNSSGQECSQNAVPCPTGQVTLTDNGSPLDLGTYSLNSAGYLEDQPIQFAAGTQNVKAVYAGDSSYTGSTGGPQTFTITQAATTITLTSSATSISSGASVMLTATVNTVSNGAAPTGTVQFNNGSTPISGAVTYTPTPASSSSTGFAYLTATLTTTFTQTATITAQYTGDINYAASPVSAPVTITVQGAPNFTLSANPTSITVKAGNSGQSTLSVTPANGFSGTVSFSCTGAPAGATCTISPASVSVSGASATTATLSITTTGSSRMLPRAPDRRISPPLVLPFRLLSLLAGLAILVFLVSLTARQWRLAGLTLASTLVLVGVWAACGGGTSGGSGPPPAPTASLSPSSLSFGSVSVNTTSSAQAVSLTNGGNASLSISSVAITGTNAGDFSQANTCGSSLQAGSSCAINVTFTPSATGSRSGTLSVTDNATGSPHQVPLTGTGTAPAASLSPSSLSFGSQNVGISSSAQAVSLTNGGNASLSISSIGIAGTNAGDFSQTNNCGSSLQAGNSCAINVKFTPSATGSRSGTLSITDNATGSPQQVTLTGTGTTGPAASLSPSSLSFGSQNVGIGSSAKAVSLTNGGNASLSISSIAITGTNAGDFGQTTTCGSSLQAGSSCTINVKFTPSAAGSRSGTLSVTDNATGSPQQVTLTGTGITPTPPGTYTLTVTATSGSISHSVNLTLTVQ